MNNQVILEENHDTVRTIILNRPDVRNAFNFELAEAMGNSLKQAAEDPKVRAVILRGSGDCFSAGGDLKLFYENIEKSHESFHKVSELLNFAIGKILTMSKPVVSAVTGPAFAAGFGVALSCDLVVATHDAKFSPSFVNIALAPNASSTFFLPRLIGPRLALEAFMTGKVFTATEAKELKMINRVFSRECFEEELRKLVMDLAQRPTEALGRMKKLVHSSASNPWRDQLNLERDEIADSSLHEHFKEGVTAFVEKRKPKFNGK